MSKEERTVIHHAIRNQFSLLDSRTTEVENDGNKTQVIRIFLKNKKGALLNHLHTFVTAVTAKALHLALKLV